MQPTDAMDARELLLLFKRKDVDTMSPGAIRKAAWRLKKKHKLRTGKDPMHDQRKLFSRAQAVKVWLNTQTA